MKKIYLRLYAIALILFFLANLDFLLFGRVMTDFLSLIKMGDIISYDKTCLLLSGAPVIILVLILSVVALFSKDAHASIPAPIEAPVVFIVVFSLIIGFIVNFVVPILLAAFSYTSCPQEKLHDYYVTDIELCKTIVDKRSFW
ncbi:DUF1240 domain-containing protein [Citrobacter rodentium]|jgi:Protein of unknown function (DUF1240).|uniref:Exported protein n=2 Tax=Citrobacter rodentium TaxID=67825 RepID=D2TLL8_CITRI|nr:DUF1240 domain-containing protein [Citrobacter rodentium]KIQ52068.1 hypothetical protein TA05_06845 [Citrobacter rodentium]QBY30673.1 DUF1240 domain-containing protein [Citrobacter rodentium]UHO31957.1 DUF1240 domain-containing protein [Citrobacter rodentium NBRC 105723 = DSM 16636]CBG91098.1 putative exported protein [Citrobacter rodentium ICC168]HAT8011274.1 hypothetical protein [Citrobacter rodentium NBRC 105723 = DSM 16636]